MAVVGAGHKEDRRVIKEWLKKEDLWDNVSPDERKFLRARTPTHSQYANATWRIEALESLAWSLSLIPDLSPPTGSCNMERLRAAVPFLEPTAAFLQNVALRPDLDLYATREEIIELHWKVRDARINSRDMPDNLDGGVVYERHYGLNWVIGNFHEPWDEVTTDT